MTQQVRAVLSQKGYTPLFESITKTLRDFKQNGYTFGEAIETISDVYGGDGGKLDEYITKLQRY